MPIGPLITTGLPVFGGGIKFIPLLGLTVGSPTVIDPDICLDAADQYPILLSATTSHDRTCGGYGCFGLYQNVTVWSFTTPTLDFTLPSNNNITGWALAFYLSSESGGTNPMGFPLTTAPGITITGTFTFEVYFATDTPTVLSDVYYWGVYRTDSAQLEQLAGGLLTVVPTADPGP